MDEHKKKPKRSKKHGKYADEQNRMDYEGGNYGDKDSSRKPDEYESMPVKRKHPNSNDSSSKRGNDSSDRDRDKGGRYA